MESPPPNNDESVRTPGRPPRLEIYQRLDTQIAELWQRMGGLPNPLEAADIWRGIWFEEAHHSTAIEGNTLVLKQVEVLLAEGRAIGDKELREYMEVRGYADAADWVYRQAISPGAWSADSTITLTDLRSRAATACTSVLLPTCLAPSTTTTRVSSSASTTRGLR